MWTATLWSFLVRVEFVATKLATKLHKKVIVLQGVFGGGTYVNSLLRAVSIQSDLQLGHSLYNSRSDGISTHLVPLSDTANLRDLSASELV